VEIKKIAVLYGGNSSEREVSLESGRSIFEAILLLGYEASLIDYPKEFSQETIKDHDYIFIALHGEDGESGALQNLLQGQDILFSGSSANGCENTWNKNRCKEFLKKHNILTPQWLAISGLSEIMPDLDISPFNRFRPFDNLFLKPQEDGSSIDVFKISNNLDLQNAIHDCKDRNRPFIFEECIDHKELTVPVLNGKCLPPVEILTTETFYNYEAKYINTDTQFIETALSQDDRKSLESLCIQTFDILECTGWARIDLLQDSQGLFYIMEVNTVPGMTSHSLFPKSAAIAGLDYKSLVQEIINGN
jgi:D-alanine-D-alanine ligase